MRGRRTPNQIKKLTGTIHHSRDIGIVVKDIITKLPPAPSHFNSTAKKLWKDVGNQCMLLGLINQGNLTPLVAYCQEMSTYIELSKEVNKEGTIVTYTTEFGTKEFPNPKFKMASEALKNAMKIATEFGLTPASIGKVGNGIKQDDDDYKKYKKLK